MRHELQPGRLLLGITFVVIAFVYAGDAGGAWESPWWLGAPVLAVGLFLAVGAVSVAYAVRGRRPRRADDRTDARGRPAEEDDRSVRGVGDGRAHERIGDGDG